MKYVERGKMKHIIISGIVFVLLIVGFNGCINRSDNQYINNNEVVIDLTNIIDIQVNPENYNQTEIIVDGYCITYPLYGHIKDEKGHYIYYIINESITGHYRLTGIWEKGNLYDFGESGEIWRSYFLNVTNVKAL